MSGGGTGAIHAQVRRQNQFSGDRPLKLTTYRDSEIDEKTIQLLKVKILLKRERACVNASRRQRCRRRRRLSKTHKTWYSKTHLETDH